MPTICEFFGIYILINWRDHNPPHFHAGSEDYEVSIAIKTGEVLDGYLPPARLKKVRKWAKLHQKELLENWELARIGRPLKQIGQEM